MRSPQPLLTMSRKFTRSALALATLLVTIVATPPMQAQTYTVLYSFTGGADGGSPYGGVIRDGAGNLYGTTLVGGPSTGCFYGTGCGTVFKLSATGQLTPLYSFTGADDGGNPATGLVRDSAGNLYGTADWAGHFTGGVAFKVTKTGSFSVLHAFPSNANDGHHPLSALIRDSAGNLYGETEAGGTSHVGTVYMIDPSGNESVLYSFTGGAADGSYPWGGVVRDGAGNLYGTASEGGASGAGIVFKVTPSSKTEKVLYNFAGGNDAQFPLAGVIRDGAGNLYGTTYNGGPFNSNGTVFKINKTGAETFLFSFNQLDGGEPRAALVRDKAGNLYGTTTLGGAGASGTVFKIDPGGNETVLYSFTGGGDGAAPYGTLILDKAGNLYGTASGGGSKACTLGCGVVFKLTP